MQQPQEKVLDRRAAMRRANRAADKSHDANAKRAMRRLRGDLLRERIRAREVRELELTGTYELPLLAARTAVGRLRRFRNDDGKLVRLA